MKLANEIAECSPLGLLSTRATMRAGLADRVLAATTTNSPNSRACARRKISRKASRPPRSGGWRISRGDNSHANASTRRPAQAGTIPSVSVMRKVSATCGCDAPNNNHGGLWVPACAQGCPGKLCIAEADLVGGASVAGGGGVDLGRSVDIGDRLSYEQRCCDEIGEADGLHDDAALAWWRCAAADKRSWRRGSCRRTAFSERPEELAKFQMLLDPAEQQFDLPASFVKSGDVDRRALQGRW